ncbi:MAG: outer membrane protein transport protein [Balneolaceae bacterium]|jgi:hypothetical protein
MSKKSYILLLLGIIVTANGLKAQSADDVLRYSLEYPSYDAISIVIPGISAPTGFGAYQENPAIMALYDKSFFSVDLSSRFLDETGTYLGNQSDFSDNQTGIGDLGILYKVPTTRGSLVVGGGYSQTTDFNRALSASGRNNQTTITDFYNVTADDSLFFAAFDTYAIDFATTDSSYADTKSIFRFFDNNFYPGINQDMELTERGALGEYSAFMATEVFKNFSVGASIGYLDGSYSYRRDFLESDQQNDYNAQFIDSNQDGTADTDIDNILSHDKIDADIQAFSARMGFVYKPTEELSIAASYEFPSKLDITENYNTTITTTFDNGIQFEDDAPGRFKYKITRPQRLKSGVTLKNLDKLTFSASAEAVFYSDARIDFKELSLNSLESSINSAVRNNVRDIVNWRTGIEYQLNDQFAARAGYAYFPSPQKGLDRARHFLSGGFSAELTRGLIFDFGLQYSFWNDSNTLYQTATTSEAVKEDVTRLHVMTGIRVEL